MNIFQKLLGTVFPPYKFGVLRREQGKLFMTIISALPDEFATIKAQSLLGHLLGIDDWDLFPGFKFVAVFYPGDSARRYKKRGQDFKITGLQIFSKRNNKFENVELLVRKNLICGLKITNTAYQLNEFDLRKIKADNIVKNDVEYPPAAVEIFYDKLSAEIKQMLGEDDLDAIDDLDGVTYYTFRDLEDGNYLAVDEKLNVYSLIHDADPTAERQEYSFIEILCDLQSGKFDIEKHFEDRYGK